MQDEAQVVFTAAATGVGRCGRIMVYKRRPPPPPPRPQQQQQPQQQLSTLASLSADRRHWRPSLAVRDDKRAHARLKTSADRGAAAVALARKQTNEPI